MAKKNPRAVFDSINAAEGLVVADLAVKIGDERHIPVKDRISWFRMIHPNGSILPSQPVYLEQLGCWLVTASVCDETGKVLAMGSGTAAYHQNDVYGMHPVECAETKAIGRALAAAGFGNQFCGDEFDTPEPIDTGVKDQNVASGSLFDEVDDMSAFENKVKALMGTYTPTMSKGIVMSFGPYNGQTAGDIYKNAPGNDKLSALEKYAYPDKPDMEHAAQIAACRVFVEAVKSSKE